MFAEASVYQWAHSAKDPDVSLYDKSDTLVSEMSLINICLVVAFRDSNPFKVQN